MMAGEPKIGRIQGGAAPTARPGRFPGLTGHGATTAAIVFSALLHGALAATVLMWPEPPVPHAIGAPIVVSLVAMAPDAGGQPEPQAGQSAAVNDAPPPTGDLAEEPPAKAAPEPDISPLPATSHETFKPQVLPEPEKTEPATTPLDIEMAAGEDTPTPPLESVSSEAVIPPRMAPPPRRPVILAHVRPQVVSSAPPPPVTVAKVSEVTENHGGESIEQAALQPILGGQASGGGEAGNPGATKTAAAGAALVGPQFTMGSARNPQPRYPRAARRRGLEGRVILRVFVEADGRVRSVDVIHSSTHAMLDEAAIEALRRWQFDPARRSGMAVASWVDIPVAFRLRD